MVAQLAARVGMSPLDVEAATAGRVKADEVADLLAAASDDLQPPGATKSEPEDWWETPASKPEG